MSRSRGNDKDSHTIRVSVPLMLRMAPAFGVFATTHKEASIVCSLFFLAGIVIAKGCM